EWVVSLENLLRVPDTALRAGLPKPAIERVIDPLCRQDLLDILPSFFEVGEFAWIHRNMLVIVIANLGFGNLNAWPKALFNEVEQCGLPFKRLPNICVRNNIALQRLVVFCFIFEAALDFVVTTPRARRRCGIASAFQLAANQHLLDESVGRSPFARGAEI